MAVYVDNAQITWRGRKWCHLVADSLDELHQFAGVLGLRRSWFQSQASFPHYDVTIETRAVALRLGAINSDRRTLISCARRLRLEHHSIHVKNRSQLSLFE